MVHDGKLQQIRENRLMIAVQGLYSSCLVGLHG